MKFTKKLVIQGDLQWNHQQGNSIPNVARPIIEIFLKYSKEYQLKRKKSVNGLVTKSILSFYYNRRMKIDLVDFQSLTDGEYKWILNAQFHITKFSHLRPLKAKSSSCVAQVLFKIFCRCGAPAILLNTIFQFNVCDKTTYPGFTSQSVPDVELGGKLFEFFRLVIVKVFSSVVVKPENATRIALLKRLIRNVIQGVMVAMTIKIKYNISCNVGLLT